jgi:hypothetical protein
MRAGGDTTFKRTKRKAWLASLWLRGMAAPATPPVKVPLKYSDYLVGASIVTGILGASQFVAAGLHGSEIVGYLGIATTVLVTLSQFLYSKGD